MSSVHASSSRIVGLGTCHADGCRRTTGAHGLSSSRPTLAHADVVGGAVADAVRTVSPRARRMLQVGGALAWTANGRLQRLCISVALGNTVAVHAALLLDIVVGGILLVGCRGRIGR